MLRNLLLCKDTEGDWILNEVLSLNAQELWTCVMRTPTDSFLNEVLSLNAQEFLSRVFPCLHLSSSMKS